MAELSRYLFLLGALPFVALGIAHALATPLTLEESKGLAPRGLAFRQSMAEQSVLLTRRTNLWLTWVGFNLSHSLGAVLFGVAYLVIGLRYWFRTPIVGIAISSVCFVSSGALCLLAFERRRGERRAAEQEDEANGRRELSLATPAIVGTCLAVAVGIFATAVGLDRDRAFYPTVAIVIASLYSLFAVMGGSTQALVLESLVGVGFVALAVLGFRTSLWVVAAALGAHGVFDSVHGAVISNPGVPHWWPAFCLTYDVAAAGYLAWLIVSRRTQAAA